MKILHINSYFYGSIFYRHLFDEQIHNGIDIDVFVPVPYSSKEYKLDLGSYTTLSFNHSKYDRFLFHLKNYKIYKDLVNKFRIEDYSIIHAHSLFTNGFIAMKLKQDYNVPYIVAVRNTDVNVFFKYMFHLRRLGVQILEEAEKIIFLSNSYRDKVVQEYVPENRKKEIYNKSIIIPNGIDDFWFKNRGIVKQINNNRLNLLYVGVINKNKNITTTVKAINILRKRGYDIKFTIVGKVQNEFIYNQLKGISFVNYIHPKSKEELITIYRNNDIFVMPSKTETFGLVYVEAMSQGLPVIYSRGQGFDKQFEDGVVGYSVRSTNYKDITNAIEKIIFSFEGISENCIQLSQRFQWGQINNDYISIYKRLSGKKRSI